MTGAQRHRPNTLSRPDFETQVLGAFMLNATEAAPLAAPLDEGDFAVPEHQLIWRVIRDLMARGQPVDLLSVSDTLAQSGELERVGGKDYIALLGDEVPTVANVVYPANVLRECTRRRALAAAGREVVEAAESGDRDRVTRSVAALQGMPTLQDPSRASPEVWTLAQLQVQSHLVAPPVAILPPLLWAGRVTLLSAREKMGKSTLAGLAAAALTSGQLFLGAPLQARSVLWIGLDEALGDIARRSLTYESDLDRLLVMEQRPRDPRALRALITERHIGAVIVDTLSDFWSGEVQREAEAQEVATFLRPWVRVIRETDAAMLLLHHLPKSYGSRYRGSTALGATMDVLATLKQPSRTTQEGEEEIDEDAEDDGRRVLRVKGRGVSDLIRLQFDGQRYQLGDAPLPLWFRILQTLDEGEQSVTEIVRTLGRRREHVLAEMRALRQEGYIVDDRGKRRLTPSGRLRLQGGAGEPGTGLGTGSTPRVPRAA